LVEKYTEDLSTLQAEIKRFLGKLKAELKN
jgi:hypothetical protein